MLKLDFFLKYCIIFTSEIFIEKANVMLRHVGAQYRTVQDLRTFTLQSKRPRNKKIIPMQIDLLLYIK